MFKLLLLFFPIILLFMLPFFGVVFFSYLKFENSEYKIVSGNSFLQTRFDKGNYGEFLTFKMLEEIDKESKILTNLYIPREDESYTEIDLVMIDQKGIYVFESKNYSGWIFGNESNKNWTQTFKNGYKNKFYNPIWQNAIHINALKYVTQLPDGVFHSYILFSERCVLKKINVSSENVIVINRDRLKNVLIRSRAFTEQRLTVEQVKKIYLLLKSYGLAENSIKEAHINNIRNKYNDR